MLRPSPGPGLPLHHLPANLQSNPSIPELSASLDETPNLVWPLLALQLHYSITPAAMPIPSPGLPPYLLLARPPV